MHRPAPSFSKTIEPEKFDKMGDVGILTKVTIFNLLTNFNQFVNLFMITLNIHIHIDAFTDLLLSFTFPLYLMQTKPHIAFLILPINCLLDRAAKLLMKMEDRKQMSTLKEELSSMILITIPFLIETIPS